MVCTLLTAEQRILYWNEGAARLTGYKAEEVLGKRCQDNSLCHVDQLWRKICARTAALIRQASPTARSHEAQVFLRHKQGRTSTVSSSGSTDARSRRIDYRSYRDIQGEFGSEMEDGAQDGRDGCGWPFLTISGIAAESTLS